MELKINDIAALLEVPEKTVLQWIQERSLPAYQINHEYLFNMAEIKEWVLKNNLNVSHKILEMSLTRHPVSLSGLLKRGGIFYGIEGNAVTETIKNAVNIMPIPQETTKEALVYSLLEREEMMPTAIGKGIAIPHPRNPILADIEHESITICFLKNPINYGAIDNEFVRTLFIILSANPKRHLEILSKISFLCQQEDYTGLLKEQKDKGTIIRYIEMKEQEWLKK